ncbi:hypothetical protein ITJ57_18785 [Plantibacter sp. VKM Ac-2880]|uniref:hypothetical protein n=1 Tax=Plantibacter sp. VKM Ac-2880 TaxID=2783827 RepID=UPI0018906C87|nr:hypothetical protein [Plantibacter sp. VKM Ac-2880]MBF4570820.1 hypothetical protein [Plantibacter sp. VKM Ac-2880]
MSSFSFYLVRSKNQVVQWVAAQENFDEYRIFGWLTDTGRWHRTVFLENTYFAPSFDDDIVFEPVDQSTAQEAMHAQPAMADHMDWLIAELQAEPTKTSEEIGLSPRRPINPASEPPDEARPISGG